MRIAINSLGVNGGGGRTYLEHFLPAIGQVDPESEYLVLVRKSSPTPLPDFAPRIRFVPVSFVPGFAGRFIREQAWLPTWLKREKVDLLFSPADSTSVLAPCPVVLAMRNMNLYVRRDPGWPLGFQLKFAALSTFAKVSARIARKIIFVSKSSGKAIAETLGISPEKQKIVYHGVSPMFFNRASRLLPELNWLEQRKPYILSVSSIYRYKNFVRLIEAFAFYRKQAKTDCHLVIAGKPYDRPYYLEMRKAIRKAEMESRVFLADEVPYTHLPWLYQNAELFVFPSYLETFGHPLVEAMASGIPIAAADIENSREITGGAAVYFDPFDVPAMAQALVNALENQALRTNLVQQAGEEVKRFSWERCAKETVACFHDALKG